MTPREWRVLALSFLVTSILGAAVVGGSWAARGQAASAAVRAGLFVAIMAGVHVAGARWYREQQLRMVPVGVAPTGTRLASSPMSPALARAIRIALAQQVPLLVLGALMLDFGVTLRIVAAAAAGHWAAILLVLVRRPGKPTEPDLILVKWGLFPLVIAAGLLGRLLRA